MIVTYVISKIVLQCILFSTSKAWFFPGALDSNSPSPDTPGFNLPIAACSVDSDCGPLICYDGHCMDGSVGEAKSETGNRIEDKIGSCLVYFFRPSTKTAFLYTNINI